MSEKFYRLLWSLHHTQFRDAYKEESLQLFRDRARAETGSAACLRLWLDLLADFALTIPRGYREAQPQLRTATAQHQDTPSFRTLENEAPRRGPLLIGGALALLLLAMLPAAFTQTAYHARPVSLLDRVRLAYQHAAGEANTPNTFAQGIGTAAAAPTAPEPKWQHDLLQAIIANVQEHYPDPVAAQKIAEALRAHEAQGGYLPFTDQAAFAAQLTKQLRTISHNPHFDVVYSPTPLPNDMSAEPNPDRLARYRQLMQDQHCTIEKAELLATDHRTGYLKLNSFPDPAICHDDITTALTSLNPAAALIIDLRDNGGGSPAMVMYLAAHLFDHPEYLYNPREKISLQSWTKSPVSGSHLAGKPLYLLTSSRTVSAAEHFAYNMKMLKRATLIGETTRGSAHAGVFHRLDDHFGMGIPEAQPLNPFSDHDWEGVGIEPDIPVNADDALTTGRTLADAKRR